MLSRMLLAMSLAWLLAQGATAQNPSPVQPQTENINALILKGYESAGIAKPAKQADDYEYMRRVFIDLIGRIPTPEEIEDFTLRDRSRVKLVQRLLNSEKYVPRGRNGQPFKRTRGRGKNKQTETVEFNYAREYADHWANIWTVWLMTRTGHQDYRDQMHIWLEKQFLDNVSHKDMVTKLLTATGTVGGSTTSPGSSMYKDDYAANFIVHHLGERINDDPATSEVDERMRDGAHDAVPITSRVTKIFLGLQTQCTQCHDHPFNREWVQSDFWGVNAFFRQTVRSATPSPAPLNNNPKMARAASVTLSDDPSLNAGMLVFYERRDGRRLGSFPIMLKDYEQALNEQKSKKMLAGKLNGGKTRREQLAEWVVEHDNFSKAYVNRIWAHFFGRGLNVEPAADNFGSTNEIVHGELLNSLAEEFAKEQYNYNPKLLMEWICTSDVYQLSHVANKAYTDIKYDAYFARMPLKAMSPEVLFESLMTATTPALLTKAQKEERKAARDAWMRKLVRNFGDDEGNELSFNGTVVQALLMMNGAELNAELGIGRDAGQFTVIHEVMKEHRKPAEVYRALFLRTLNRLPTVQEIDKLNDVASGKARITVGPAAPPKRPGGKTSAPKAPVAAADNAYDFYQDVLWALLNTNEFMLNH
jgi:hypothetical protein